MKYYKWHKEDGLLDEDGTQILQIVASHCSAKFRNMAAKELATKLNTIEQGNKKLIHKYIAKNS